MPNLMPKFNINWSQMDFKYTSYFLCGISISCFIFCLGVIIEISSTMSDVNQYKKSVDTLKSKYDQMATNINKTNAELEQAKQLLVKANQTVEYHLKSSSTPFMLYSNNFGHILPC